jgi:hypothetical protein
VDRGEGSEDWGDDGGNTWSVMLTRFLPTFWKVQ